MSAVEHILAIQTALDAIEFPNTRFLFSVEGMYLQIECTGRCNTTGAPMTWKGRKWRLSRHMTKSEVVQTAFLAVLTAAEHEVRETFKYRGAAIFGPHFDVDRLVQLAGDAAAQDVRA